MKIQRQDLKINPDSDININFNLKVLESYSAIVQLKSAFASNAFLRLCNLSTSSIYRQLPKLSPPLIILKEESLTEYRYLIVFATRDVADEWWRAIQTAAANNVNGWNTVSRVTPQHYTHNPGRKNIRESIAEKDVASQLSTKIFFQLLNDRDGRGVDIIPTQFTQDHINGIQ